MKNVPLIPVGALATSNGLVIDVLHRFQMENVSCTPFLRPRKTALTQAHLPRDILYNPLSTGVSSLTYPQLNNACNPAFTPYFRRYTNKSHEYGYHSSQHLPIWHISSTTSAQLRRVDKILMAEITFYEYS